MLMILVKLPKAVTIIQHEMIIYGTALLTVGKVMSLQIIITIKDLKIYI